MTVERRRPGVKITPEQRAEVLAQRAGVLLAPVVVSPELQARREAAHQAIERRQGLTSRQRVG